jgi:nucleoside-diphosphate-sugar epimerase
MGGRRVAVTGAAGFLGAHLVDRLAGVDCQIVRVTRSAAPSNARGMARITDVAGDVSDRGVWDCLIDADVIFHFAAQTSGAVAAEDPDADFDANVTPMRHLLAACRERARRPLVLFAGTVTQAGIPARLPVNEDAPDNPVTIYDRHKLMAERELETAALTGSVCGVTLRLSNVYGPGAHAGAQDRDVLNRMIAAALRGQALSVHGSGAYVRDYVFIEDVIDAFLRAAARADRVNGRHFVVGSGRGTTIREAFELIACRVSQITGRDVAVAMSESGIALSPIERRNFVADPSRFSAATGWRPAWSLARGIDRTIEAYTCA